MTLNVAVEVTEPVTSDAVTLNEYVPRAICFDTLKMSDRGSVCPADTVTVSLELAIVVVWPVGLTNVIEPARATFLLTSALLVSAMLPVTTVPVVALLGETETATRRSTRTVTVKVADTAAGLSSELRAVQVTVVVPTAKVEPDAGAQLAVAAGLSPASSITVGCA